MVRDPRQEGARENAVKAPGILPREVKEAWDQTGAEAEVRVRVKAEVVAEARVEAEAPVRAVATVNI
jgi:hypothetical protein